MPEKRRRQTESVIVPVRLPRPIVEELDRRAAADGLARATKARSIIMRDLRREPAA